MVHAYASVRCNNMPRKKKRRTNDQRKADREKSMPDWKRKKMEQSKAGIKSGTDPARWRDPKTGGKAYVPPRYEPPEKEEKQK